MVSNEKSCAVLNCDKERKFVNNILLYYFMYEWFLLPVNDIK